MNKLNKKQLNNLSSSSSANRLLTTLQFFYGINEEHKSRGEVVVPFHKDSVDHYRTNMEKMNCPIEDTEEFCSWLETIDPQPEATNNGYID